MLGFYVEVEHATSDGRMDLLMKTKDYIYILEFKINESADAALKQIEDRGYARTIEAGYEKIMSYGIAFFQKTAMIKKL